ncbi:MAG: hypothetical protein ACPG4T_24960, partial [Nannocystaceae bacterium]
MREVKLRLRRNGVEFAGSVVATAELAQASFERASSGEGTHVLLGGDRPYHVVVTAQLTGDDLEKIVAAIGSRVLVKFAKRRALRRKLVAVGGKGAHREPKAVDLLAPFYQAIPLYLRHDGTLSRIPEGGPPLGLDALDTLVAAARWVSSRRTTTFTRLFVP